MFDDDTYRTGRRVIRKPKQYRLLAWGKPIMWATGSESRWVHMGWYSKPEHAEQAAQSPGGYCAMMRRCNSGHLPILVLGPDDPWPEPLRPSEALPQLG